VVSGASGCLTGWVNYPYGNGLVPASIGTTECVDGTEHHFTSKERDSETGFEDGNDYFFARYFGSETGRFLSPDYDETSDDPIPYADLDDPQTLNRYEYVGNNPLSGVDQDGHGESGCTTTTTQKGEGKDVTYVVTVTCTSPPPPLESPHDVLDRELFGWMMNSSVNAAVWGKPSAAQARAIWEKATGEKVPYDEKLGRNYDMEHVKPVADGGDPKDPANLRPIRNDIHVAKHKENGDYKRWGARSRQEAIRKCNCDSPEEMSPNPGAPTAEEPVAPVEGEPPIMIPEQ
jgi:RHS repeat-associated protein